MSKLQELLAKKRADQAKEASMADKSAAENHAADIKAATDTLVKISLADPVKEEGPALAVPKVMSFAEKMALRKKMAEAATNQNTQVAQDVKPSAEAPAPTPVLVATQTPTTEVIATVQQIPNSVEEKLRTGVLDASLDKNPMPPPDAPAKEDAVDPQVAQAYADIKVKIDNLSALSDEPLEGAMKDLKQALMKNPAAVSLMEDTDIGQLVIALRKITGEAITEAAKEKKPGRKTASKQVDLSDPAAVAAIFDEF